MIMTVELVHIGFGNILAMNRAIAIASPNSAPTKRTIQDGRNKGTLIDMTSGRRTKAVIFTDSGHIILAALAPETIAGRLQSVRGGSMPRPEQSDEKSELWKASPIQPARPGVTHSTLWSLGNRQRCRSVPPERIKLPSWIHYNHDHTP